MTAVTLADLAEVEAAVARVIDTHPAPLAVDRRTAARMLSVSDTTFGRLVKAGHIAKVPHLNPARYAVAELERFVSAGASRPAGTPAAGLDGPSGTTGTPARPSGMSPLQRPQAADRTGPHSTAGSPDRPPAA